ncbi:MAG TPA: MarR family transcriptional regulator [Gaiellaceae bacterium]|jgi:DNA-binding MarR family transcriptional regulator|nr:MarR family transcriptional regulator [Gaiellaceae bacterium]
MPVATLTPLEVANRLRPALLKLARELRRESHALGVTGGQVSLLIQIQRHRGIGVRGLASLERMSPASMSGYVERLERAGLVRKTQDPNDKRRQGLSLTEEGDRVVRSVKSRRTAWLAARLEQLEPEELTALDAAVEPLLNLVEGVE